MNILLFVILPYHSHYMSAFAFAHELEKKGFKVIFTGNDKNIEKLVQHNGFDYIEMVYQTEYNISSFKHFVSFLTLSIISNIFLFERCREFYSNIVEVKRLIKLTKANSIFIDEHLYQYYFYFLSQKCRIFILRTKLLTSKQGNNPPLSSNYIPKSTFGSKVINELLWFKVLWNHKFKTLKFKLSFCGKDDVFFIKRFCIKQNINYRKMVNEKNTFYYGIKSAYKITLAPKYLDIHVECNEYKHIYIYLEYKRKEATWFTESYIKLKNQIDKTNNLKIILCSFGTVLHENNAVIINFLDRLSYAVEGKNFVLIIVSKNPNIVRNKNPNIHILSIIPQLDLLKYCDLMIHHAGLNTIKECLQFQVPMLIYTPKKNSFDRIGNAARVQFKGLGIVGNIYKDNPIKIYENIKKALLIEMPKQNYEQEYDKVNKFIEEELMP